MFGLLWTLTACPGPPPLDLTDPVPVLEVDATSFEFEALELGAEAAESLTVTNAGDLELSLELSLEGSRDFSVASASRPYFLEPDESRTFEVVFSPSAVESLGMLVLTSDDPERPELEIPLAGQGALPMLEIDPVDHDFGNIGINCQEVVDITLANVGDSDLTISSIAHSGIGFSMEPVEVPFILEPEESTWVVVSVELNELGPASGQLFVVSDAPSGQLVANQEAMGIEVLGGCN